MGAEELQLGNNKMQSNKILSSLKETILVTCTKYIENRGQFQNSLREKNSDYTILPFTHNRQSVSKCVDSDSKKKCFTFWISTVLNLLTLPEHTKKNNKTMLNFLVVCGGKKNIIVNLILQQVSSTFLRWIYIVLYSVGYKFPT